MLDKIVRDLRTKKGISSKKLSSKMGMNETWVSQIETGRIKHPHLPTFKNMLRYLEVTEEDINNIIIKAFEDIEKDHSVSQNKIDYKIERKYLLSKKTPLLLSEIKKSLKSDVMTQEEFTEKCKSDAHQLYVELKQLPQETVDHLLAYLMDDL